MPVAAISRPPGRLKLRPKCDEKAGLPAMYTARNLDMCTRQLGHWNPFACSAAGSPEHKFGDHMNREGAHEEVILRVGDLQQEQKPKSVTGAIGEDGNHILASGFRNLAVSPECCNLAGSAHRGNQARGFESWPLFGESWLNCASNSGIDKEVFEFGKLPNEHVSRAVQGRRVHAWSKRRKQLSKALARGLWRWKDGFHARKRMKRCGPGGACNSGSDKSSDRAPYGVHASDPSTAPTSKAGPFKWSDFPITPTDSSGELFYCAKGGNGSTLLELKSLGKDWTACGCVRVDGITGGADCDHCWLGNEHNSGESGYGSEPGYRGDEELEFGDIDEQDEEEREPEHLRMWRQVMASHDGPQSHSLEMQRSVFQAQGRNAKWTETQSLETLQIT